MKIAVATTGGKVSVHFGHSECFEVFRITGSVLDMRESVLCPPHDSCDLPGFLKGLGVDAVIVGGIGGKAIDLLAEAGIEVFSGAYGEAHAALAAYIRGDLTKGADACAHEEGQGCRG